MCLSACGGKNNTGAASAEEMITISFVNSVRPADVWIIENTEENRKTTVWGDALLKDSELEKEYSVSIPGDKGDTYLFRMIDDDHMYYELNDIRLMDGYSINIYLSEKDDREIRAGIYDDKGEEVLDTVVFNAAL